MSGLAEEGATEVEEYVVVWFPPDRDKSKSFATEDRARQYVAREEIAAWNPLLEHRITLTVVTSELLPL